MSLLSFILDAWSILQSWVDRRISLISLKICSVVSQNYSFHYLWILWIFINSTLFSRIYWTTLGTFIKHHCLSVRAAGNKSLAASGGASTIEYRLPSKFPRPFYYYFVFNEGQNLIPITLLLVWPILDCPTKWRTNHQHYLISYLKIIQFETKAGPKPSQSSIATFIQWDNRTWRKIYRCLGSNAECCIKWGLFGWLGCLPSLLSLGIDAICRHPAKRRCSLLLPFFRPT